MFVDEVMGLVELDSLRDTLVGLLGVSGLSTNQWKGLTIIVELVANPSLIFIDVSTSGLDVRAAAIVMCAVHRMDDSMYYSSTTYRYFRRIRGGKIHLSFLKG